MSSPKGARGTRGCSWVSGARPLAPLRAQPGPADAPQRQGAAHGAHPAPPAPSPHHPPAGAVATGGVLLGGLVAFKNGKSALAQHFMRARVVTQGITVAIMLSSGGYLAVEAAQQRALVAKGSPE